LDPILLIGTGSNRRDNIGGNREAKSVGVVQGH
jgi:hypothetical protein